MLHTVPCDPVIFHEVPRETNFTIQHFSFTQKMYEISNKTLEVISLALHDLCAMQLKGPDALRALAQRIRFHAGLHETPDEESADQAEVSSIPQIYDVLEVEAPREGSTAEGESPIAQPGPSKIEENHDVVPAHSEKITIIFVLGGPGCGKGTICKRLVDDFGFAHLSVGEVLRAEVASGSQLGQEVQQLMKDGLLVSDDIALRVIRDAINRACLHGSKILLDGFPRTVEQAVAFEHSVCTPSQVLWLTCEDSILVNRILARGQASGREDDNAETAAMRLKTFNENTSKIRSFYETKEEDLFKVVDSSLSVDEVYDKVKTALEL